MKKVFKKVEQDKLHCKWEKVIGHDEYFETECDSPDFPIIHEKFLEHIKYCPYCGRWIKEVKS